MEPSSDSLNPQDAVLYAMKQGMEKFLIITRSTGAARILEMEEKEIISEFALYLLELKAKPVYQYKGKSGASFKTYIAVVYRNWLLRKFDTKKRKTIPTTNELPEDSKDFRSLPEESFESQEKDAFILDALKNCMKLLSKSSRDLLDKIRYSGKQIKEIAIEMKIKPSELYNQNYAILSTLRKCLKEKGIDKGMVLDNG